jgi:SAM-dependent methyltransferase
LIQKPQTCIVNEYLSGKKLYGDELLPTQIEDWHRDELEGYANLDFVDSQKPVYLYHRLNILHGFSYLPNSRLSQALGIGSAYGEEFEPIINQIDSLTVLDPSDKFVRCSIHGIPVRYFKPAANGMIPFGDETFDLITCFSVLHHIPNVTFVVNEVFRCLKKGGFALIREPIVSMGDWNQVRSGLTKHERGIPMAYFDNIINNAHFEVLGKNLCVFPPLSRLSEKFGLLPYNDRFLTRLDRVLCYLTQKNATYHRTRFLEKLGPAGIFYVLTKTRCH